MKLQLIRELNSDHLQLVSCLDSMKGKKLQDKDTIELIKKFKNLVLAHLEKEEKEFYPIMLKAAETNDILKDLLRVMGLEMEEISKKAMMLIALWEQGKGAERFASDFSSLYTILKDRIKREETRLYSKFLKL